MIVMIMISKFDNVDYGYNDVDINNNNGRNHDNYDNDVYTE